MAAARGLKVTTITTHLTEAIKAGLPVKTESLGLKEDVKKLVEKAIASKEIGGCILRLGPIKTKCEKDYSEEISWDDIKIVVALLIKKYGIKDDVLCWDPSTVVEESPSSSSAAAAATPLPKLSQANSQTSSSVTGKRELPDWMKPSASKEQMKKKIKKNSLFK